MRLLQSLTASFLVSAAISYSAAFNMVGWNFLLPGRYSFGLICATCLVITVSIGLRYLAIASIADVAIAACGMSLALVVIGWSLGAGVIAFKDYFIWGLVALACVIGGLLNVTPDLQSLLRQKMYLMPVAVIVSAALLYVIRLPAAKVKPLSPGGM